MPPNRVAFCGNMSTAPIAIASPNVATAEQNADAAFGCQADGQNDERRYDNDRFGRCEFEQIQITHFKNLIASTAGIIRSSKSLG